MPYYTLRALAKASTEASDATPVPQAEAREVFREVYRSVPEPEEITLEDSETLRTASLYRILRYMLRSLGQLGADESLGVRIKEIYKSSGAPVLLAGAPDPSMRGSQAIQKVLKEVPRMSLVPLTGDAVELHALEKAYATVATELGLNEAIVALFTHPKHLWSALPTSADVLDYEAVLLEAVYEEIVAHGLTKARQELQVTFGMRPREAHEISLTARYVMASAIEVDQETERKIQSDRLERLMASANESMDTRMELASIKERNRLLGLTDRPPKDTTKEIMDVIAHVSQDSQDQYDPDFDSDDEPE